MTCAYFLIEPLYYTVHYVLLHTASRRLSARSVGVIGAGGFVGRHLMKRLARAGLDTTSIHLDRDASGVSDNRAHLCDRASDILCEQVRAVDTLVMLAGVPPARDRSHRLLPRNAEIVAGLCDALSRVPSKHVVYLSSDSVYPSDADSISERTCAAPSTLYGMSHRVREALLGDVCREALLVVRSTMIYGHGDTHDAYGPNRMCRQAVQDRRIEIFGQGEDVRDYLEISDLVELLTEAVLRRTVGVINAVSGEPVRVCDVACAVADRTGADIQTMPRRQTATERRFSDRLLRRAFPEWTPTPIGVGLERLITAQHDRAGL
jgi:UDP-glucose 4-epimerase